MASNVLISGTQTGPREESDIRFNYGDLSKIICASTQLGGTQPMSFSTDGGSTWSQASLPSVTGDARQGDPTIDWTSDGTAWSVTIGISSNLVLRTFKSTDNGKTWTFDSTVTTTQTNMDRQSLWIDHSPTSPFKDNMYLIWHNGTPNFVSVRAGSSGAWGAPIQVSGSESTGTATGCDIKTNANGDVFAFWADTGSGTIFVSKSTDGGSTFAKPVKVADTSAAGFFGVPAQDGRQLLIYVSGGAFHSATEDNVYACWFDLAGGSGCDSTGDAPGTSVTSACKTRVFFSRSTDGGKTWSTTKLNDQNSLNDQFMTRLAVDEATGALVVVYYDTVDDPGRVKTDLWTQTSPDGGASWTAATKITSQETDETSAGAQSNFQYGDYIGLTGFSGNFFACWTDRRAGGLEQIWGAPLTTTDCVFIIDKSTFGKDEVAATPAYAPAFWVAVDGFTNTELGFASPADLGNANPNPLPSVSAALDSSLNTGLTPAQQTAIANNLPTVNTFGPLPVVAQDTTLAQEPQRFMYPFTLSFASTAGLAALLPHQVALVTLTASITVGQIVRTASAVIELTAGEDPYFVDVNPLAPQQESWLSFDLRFFKVNGGATRFGVTPSMSNDANDAPTFIANVITQLNTPGANLMGDSFEGLTQDEELSALEFTQQDDDGTFVFNFALARVRLLGNTPGAQASAVRLFFRLFQAQTTNSTFNDQTTYRFASDGTLNGHKIALLGVQNDQNNNPEYVTIPCFASPRINLSAPANTGDQTDPPNVQTITVNPGQVVEAYFGCWLDINQPQQQFLPQTPPAGNFDGPWSGITPESINQVLTRAPHQCLIAEIRYDDTPIPAGATSSTSDKLAQRNIAWIDGPNPGSDPSRLMPHPFEIRSSPAAVQTPDELMILWGDTPANSTASFYLPALSAQEIVRLANVMYGAHLLTQSDTHTIACPASGVTFIPIPKGTARNAGLLTIDLPAGIRRGQRFDIVVRQITESSILVRPQPQPEDLEARAERLNRLTWRRLLGAFQFTLAIATKETLLFREERLLAWLRWIVLSIPSQSRWHPVVVRYIEQIAGRVLGLGGDPGQILPSPTGNVPGTKPKPSRGECEFSGKVEGIVYDRFGDFEGFILRTESGYERAFRGRESEIEALVREAWIERHVISVFVRDGEDWPVRIVLRRAPKQP